MNPASRGRVDPQLPAGEAVRQLLCQQFELLQAQEPGTRLGEDPECLHDFRVAVRRTRSLLSQLKAVLPAGALRQFGPEFAWLGAVTSATRDLDVYLLRFPLFRDSLPAPARDDLDPLHRFLLARRDREQARLVAALDSQRYRQLNSRWRSFLEADCGGDWPEKAHWPLRTVVDARLGKTLGKVLREGAGISDQSPATALHQLRKRCKKLRYLLEFFQDLYPRKQLVGLIASLKGLQDNLGEFQDLQVQSEALLGFSDQMIATAQAPPRTLLALGMLVEGLRGAQQRARQEFAERFAGFDSGQSRRLLENLRARRSLAATLHKLKEKNHGQLSEG